MKTKRMNKVVKAKWLKALRSGKYKQARYKLKDRNKFCCLGVLTDLWRHEIKPDWDSGIDVPCISGEDTVLPGQVVEWAGLSEDDPQVRIKGKRTALSSLNDDGYEANDYRPCNFKHIADIIEKKL